MNKDDTFRVGDVVVSVTTGKTFKVDSVERCFGGRIGLLSYDLQYGAFIAFCEFVLVEIVK